MPLARLADQFEARARLCSSGAELSLVVEDAARELGFRFFALLHHASLRSSSGLLIRIDNYPEGWVEELLGKHRVAGEPVHLASGRTNVGFAWTELPGLVSLTGAHRDILRRSRRFGLGEGFTVPANVPGEPSGSCSFAVRRGIRLPRQRLMCAELIGAHAFRAARRLHNYPAAGVHPHLSPREREVLHLLAAGKTDWEIARIIGIGVQTAHQYVKRARAAYDVVSRTQLVVHGLRDAWISFDDAIPPPGGMD